MKKMGLLLLLTISPIQATNQSFFSWLTRYFISTKNDDKKIDNEQQSSADISAPDPVEKEEDAAAEQTCESLQQELETETNEAVAGIQQEITTGAIKLGTLSLLTTGGIYCAYRIAQHQRVQKRFITGLEAPAIMTLAKIVPTVLLGSVALVGGGYFTYKVHKFIHSSCEKKVKKMNKNFLAKLEKYEKVSKKERDELREELKNLRITTKNTFDSIVKDLGAAQTTLEATKTTNENLETLVNTKALPTIRALHQMVSEMNNQNEELQKKRQEEQKKLIKVSKKKEIAQSKDVTQKQIWQKKQK